MKKKIIIISIIVLLFLIGIGVTYGIHLHKENNKVYSVITIDVNPSLKLSLNKDDKVLKVEALNKDAEVIEEKAIVGKKIDKAIEVVVDKLEEEGYLKEAILINVESDKKELKGIVEEEVKKVTEEKVEVIVQSIEVTKEIKKVAEENNISESKAAYVLEQIKDIEEIDIKDVVDKNIEEVKTVVEEKKEEIKKAEEEKTKEEEKKQEQSNQTTTNPNNSGSTTTTKPNNSGSSTTTTTKVTCTPPSDIKSDEWCTWNVKRPQSCEYYYPGRVDKDISELDARYGGGYGNRLGSYGTIAEYKGASYCYANKTVYTTNTYRYTAYWDSVTGELLKETKEAVPTFVSEESVKKAAIQLFGLNEEDIVMIWVSTDIEGEGGSNWYYRHQVNIEMPEKKMYTANYNAVTGSLVSKRVWENIVR